jgi:hypothetical protein
VDVVAPNDNAGQAISRDAFLTTTADLVVHELYPRRAVQEHDRAMSIREDIVLDDPVRVPLVLDRAVLHRVRRMLHGEALDRDII